MKSTQGPPARIVGVQRLDKWLWFARMAKTRTLAAGLVLDGKVRVNRQKAEKPSLSVRVGDVLTITTRSHVRILKITAPGARRGPPASAQQLYEDLTPRPPEQGEGSSSNQPAEATGSPRQGRRPTKRDRRALDRLTGNEQ
jgi:ribosome-associated heat shock protein Hsp15